MSRAEARHLTSGVWRSLAARFVRDEEAAGSNPATPTTFSQLQARFRKTLEPGFLIV